MSTSAALRSLQHSILRGDGEAAALLRVNPRMTAQQQIAIYSDAYRLRLRHAVQGDYPCLGDYLGATLFEGLIDAYVESTPSLSYNLDFYPFGFWRFVQKNLAQAAMRELAELEGAIAEVFLTAGSTALQPQELQVSDEDGLGRVRFHLRAPHRLLHFTHDVESAMAGFKRGEERVLLMQKPAYLFVHRHEHEVQRRVLEEGEYHLLTAIGATGSFDAAIQTMMDVTGSDDHTVAAQVERWLPRWIGQGFFGVPPASMA